MSTAQQRDLISVEEYLDGEQVSKTRHEYVGGSVYAMSGGRNQHNLIAGNAFAFLHSRLRGSSCRPYNPDTKIRIRFQSHIRFYYPDTSVTCQPNAPNETFQDQPVVIVEVLSDSTRRVDEGEKKDAYLTIPSLQIYLLVEPDSPAVTIHRRTDQGFTRETVTGSDAVIAMPEIGTELPLSELYDGADFPAGAGADHVIRPDEDV
jgi:Uma2 family endonuclease